MKKAQKKVDPLHINGRTMKAQIQRSLDDLSQRLYKLGENLNTDTDTSRPLNDEERQILKISTLYSIDQMHELFRGALVYGESHNVTIDDVNHFHAMVELSALLLVGENNL